MIQVKATHLGKVVLVNWIKHGEAQVVDPDTGNHSQVRVADLVNIHATSYEGSKG